MTTHELAKLLPSMEDRPALLYNDMRGLVEITYVGENIRMEFYDEEEREIKEFINEDGFISKAIAWEVRSYK